MSKEIKNPIEQKILDLIVEDINQSQKGFSYLTNNEIAERIKISVFSVRDKILKLQKTGHIQNVLNYWYEIDGKPAYHNRVIFKGNA